VAGRAKPKKAQGPLQTEPPRPISTTPIYPPPIPGVTYFPQHQSSHHPTAPVHMPPPQTQPGYRGPNLAHNQHSVNHPQASAAPAGAVANVLYNALRVGRLPTSNVLHTGSISAPKAGRVPAPNGQYSLMHSQSTGLHPNSSVPTAGSQSVRVANAQPFRCANCEQEHPTSQCSQLTTISQLRLALDNLRNAPPGVEEKKLLMLRLREMVIKNEKQPKSRGGTT
jgi:hypothetical protein